MRSVHVDDIGVMLPHVRRGVALVERVDDRRIVGLERHVGRGRIMSRADCANKGRVAGGRIGRLRRADAPALNTLMASLSLIIPVHGKSPPNL